MRWLAWLLMGFAGLLVLLPALLWVSSWASLDRQRRHSAETADLPAPSADTSGGLVRIPARGMEFRARVAGLESEGPALVLLHGFPETSAMWVPLLPAARALGFRVVAFDQRGYSPGARPEASDDYVVPELLEDLTAVADALGFERFHLVGHDWGAVVGWVAAARLPERVLSYTALSIPHPAAISTANAERGVPRYVRFFQTPHLPEAVFTAGGLFLLRGVYREMPEEQSREYLAVFSEPGALRAALHWYRAQAAFVEALEQTPPVSQPVLYVFGNRDMPVFVRPEVRALHERFVTGPFQEVELDAGHWLIQEQPERVVELVMDHLNRQPAAR